MRCGTTIISAPPLLWEVPESRSSLENLPKMDVPAPRSSQIPQQRKQLLIPNHSELDIVRHYKALGKANFSIDGNMYPLGSCTMKYNPKICEEIASGEDYLNSHPYAGSLKGLSARIIYELQEYLADLTGLPGVSLTPAAGAQGEFAGVEIMKEYHASRGEKRNTVLIPDSAHGTNPASVAMAGLIPVTLKTGAKGRLDIEDLKNHLDSSIAGIMITNPNTLGLFEDSLQEICREVHQAGGLVYGDGANFNALAGIVRPGELGIDIMHLNLHKTFGTPHGGGGPGAGPICVTQELRAFLPGPVVIFRESRAERRRSGSVGEFLFMMPEKSIGRLRTFYGNFGILLRAYVYLLFHGPEGIRQNSTQAVINANYLMKKLKDILPTAYPGFCMHEFVCPNPVEKIGIHTMDIAKRLLDYGIHAPTVYFPLIVKEALMIEPTESESLSQLDEFVEVITKIIDEAERTPELLTGAPNELPLKRLDEVRANKKPVFRHRL